MESQDETARISAELKQKAEELRVILNEIEIYVSQQHEHASATGDTDEMQRLQDADPYRWLTDAQQSMRIGFMFAHRAISQPTHF